MDKVLATIALGIKVHRRAQVSRGDVFDGGIDDGIVVLDAKPPSARCVRVSGVGLRVVTIRLSRLQREFKLLGENDAAAVIRTMQRHLKKTTRPIPGARR